MTAIGDKPARRPKVAFVCIDDAADPHIVSGGPHKIRQGFVDLGCELVDIFPIKSRSSWLFIPKKILYRVLGRYYHWEWETLYQRQVARHIERVLDISRPDLVYVVQPQACTHLSTHIPVVMSHDQTFVERLSYFPFEKRPPCAEYVGQAVRQERKAFENVDLAVYPSRRSVAAIQSAYGIPDHRAAMIPWGGNNSLEPNPVEARQMIADRGFGPFRLTFIGVDWQRKGGDVVLEAHRAMRDRGYDIRLTIIGTVPNEEVDHSVTVIPFIHKDQPEDIARLSKIMASTHLLFVPSRVEAFGHVFCEAAAFAVPSVATDVGGIPTIIEHGVNGLRLPLTATGHDFAEAIIPLFNDRTRYTAMAEASRARFENDLNWKAFCRTILDRFVSHRVTPTELRL